MAFDVLVADIDTKQSNDYSSYLMNANNNLNVINVNNGIDVLTKYNTINPNVLIIDTKFNDIPTYQIIDRISSTRKESKICNIILLADSNENIYPISNTQKIYKILFKPFKYEELEQTVSDICMDTQTPELSELDLKLFLLELKFNLCSTSTRYLIEAIHQCYYYPNLIGNLDDIIKMVAYKFNVAEKNIKFAFRNALKPLNNYRFSMKNNTFIKLFDESRNITPKYFLEIIVTYLHKQNR